MTSTEPNGSKVDYASIAETSDMLRELEERELSKEELIRLQEIWYRNKWDLRPEA